jgi:protein-L-isoaspartate(D-aspartate) O-methyltransferase
VRAAPALLVVLAIGGGVTCEAATEHAKERAHMVRTQIEARGVKDPRVLEAMRTVPRHLFAPEAQRHNAYDDGPLPIGHGQTLSQPYIVAVMTEELAPEAGDVVLDVGTGSGYQAAVLAKLVKQVISIEIVPQLADAARERLAALGYANVEVITGDGWRGLPERAPFDGILVAAAPPEVPPALLEQLAPGARLVIPIGEWQQDLRVYERTARGLSERTLFGVRFVPLVHGKESE